MGHPQKYGVVLDAGSSGTRVYIYRWDELDYARGHARPAELKQLPEIETKKHWTKKTKPGVSSFGSKPYHVGEYLQPLLQHAIDIIPAESAPETPLFLLATAGVRLLPPREQKVLLEQICTYARKHTKFLLPECNLHVQVISGETEGLYGWIAANYLLGGFDKTIDHGNGHHTYGFLDMGGASAQIAFAPNATEAKKHAQDLKLLRLRTVGGMPEEYQVFVTTWLGLGMNEARVLYIKRLMEASAAPGVKELPEPCLPKGVTTTLEGEEDLKKKKNAKDPVLVGTGRFEECLRQTYPLLQKDVPCMDAPCLLKGVHVPGIDFTVNHFVGVSEFWHSTHEIFDFGKDHPYDYTEYQTKVKEFCAQDWKDIKAGIKKGKWGDKVEQEKAMQACFKASWLTNIMHEGIGIPRVGIEVSHNVTDHTGAWKEHKLTKEEKAKEKGFLEPFQAVNKINGMELSWTLGKIVLYATSQIPAAFGQTALPVGFGSNTVQAYKSVPADWQYAGAVHKPGSPPPVSSSPPGSKANITDGDASQEQIVPTGHHLGLWPFIFLGMLLLFFYIGRERRARLYRRCGSLVTETAIKIRSTIMKRRRSFSGPTYERLIEEGAGFSSGAREGGNGFAEVELFGVGTADDGGNLSDSSSGSSGGKSSRYLRVTGGEGKAAIRAGSTGLMVRVESRERIARSRDVSPTGLRSARVRSPLPRLD